MPVTTDTLYNTKRLNVLFAISAFLTLGAMLWMFKHDYDRPWRHVQREYFNVRSAMAHFDVLAFEAPDMMQKHERLLENARRANEALASGRAAKRRKELSEKEETLAGELQGSQLTYGNLNAEMQVRLFNYEEAVTLKGADDPETVAIAEENEAAEKKLQAARKRMEKTQDLLAGVRADLKALNAEATSAEKALAAFEKDLNDAKRFDKMFGPGFTRAAFNLPLLDYLAPSGAPGREEIRQVFSKSIRFDYNFVDSYVTDRCITCHYSIDDPTFGLEAFTMRTEKALRAPRVVKVLTRENARLTSKLTDRLAAAGQAPVFAKRDLGEMDSSQREEFIRALVGAANQFLDEIERPELATEQVVAALMSPSDLTRSKVTTAIEGYVQRILWGLAPTVSGLLPTMEGEERVKSFGQMSEEERMTYVASLTAAMNLYLEDSGRPKIDFGEELRAHPRLDLFVGMDSPHPMKKMGCTVCHEGDGQETDFVLAAHTPENKKQEEEWEREYYVKEMGVPLATFELVEDFWEWPMLLKDYTSASCKKCHEQAFDLERYETFPLPLAENLVEGRELFTSVGCINCHNVEGLSDARQVGTDLSHVREKLTRGFMERWVEYPRNFRPSTWMPSFFLQENNLPLSANEFDPDPVLRTQAEIQAMVHYLRTFSKPLENWDELPTDVPGDPAHGEELFTSIGCLACHANLAAKDPLTSDGKTIGETWITRDLMMREGLSEEDARARYEKMTANDRACYASQTFTGKAREAALDRAAEEEFAADKERRDPDPRLTYVPPEFTRIGPELSGIGTKLVDDPNDADQVKHGRRWVYNWLREPRHYSSYTKMPRMFRENYYASLDPEVQRQHNDQDILDVSEYLLSLRNDEFDRSRLPDDDAHRRETESLILLLLGGQNTQAVSRMILNDEKAVPSDAYGRLTAAIIKQCADSFGGGPEGAARVAELIKERSDALPERQRLFLGLKMITHYGCSACHRIPGFENATRPGTDMTLWAQKFMSQLDFAFYSPAFETEIEEQPELFGQLYIDEPEFAHLIRDAGGNRPADISYNHASFAYHKMSNPRIWDRAKIKKPYEKLKMPNFALSEAEAKAVTTFLLSMRSPNVAKPARVDYEESIAGRIAAGRALVRELNCIGCHNIEGNQATIHQYYSTDPTLEDTNPRSERFKPPLLWGEGAKVQFNWLFTFLNNVEMLRPWLQVRMPSFHLTTDQTTALVGYFAALTRSEAETLKSRFDPVLKQMEIAHGGGNEPAPAERWYMQDRLKSEADFLARYAVSHKQIRRYDLDPGDATDPAAISDHLQPGYETALRRADFLSSLFDIQYPFADANKHLVSDDDFVKGEKFLYDLKCLSCHVAGDPKAPGTTTDIKAPNFALTHKRLRYDWVVRWLQDPQAIQPGANMPQIFQGGSAFAGLPETPRKEKEDEFGSSVAEQSGLLVDFLFTLGERNYTAIQPGGPAAPAATSQPAEEAEFDFESGDEPKKEEEPGFDF